MARHGTEVAIVVEQRPAVLDAPGADQQTDGLADGDAAPAQGTEIAGCRNGNRISRHVHDFEAPQQGFDFPSRPFIVKALQHLAQHQIADYYLFSTYNRVQLFDMGRVPAVKEVDPDAAVDNDHPTPRPLRL